jgi:hypothetical protein
MVPDWNGIINISEIRRPPRASCSRFAGHDADFVIRLRFATLATLSRFFRASPLPSFTGIGAVDGFRRLVACCLGSGRSGLGCRLGPMLDKALVLFQNFTNFIGCQKVAPALKDIFERRHGNL